jgi:hypothetical protein
MRARASLVLVACVAVASAAKAQQPPAPPAHDSDAACTAAYTGGQRLRKKGQLTAAKKQLTTCASPACSSVLRDDCTRWLAEVAALMPSLVIAARGPSGEDATDVRVLVDGTVLADRVGGVPLEVDPGPHRLRFEMQGAQPLEKDVVVREGERARRIDVAFVAGSASASASESTSASAPAPTAASTAEPSPPGESQEHRRPIPTLAWVLGGVGAAALAVGIGFEIDGLSKRSSLGSCYGNCNQSDVDAAKRSFNIGDVATGIGIVGLAAAAYVFFTRPASQPSTTSSGLHLDVVPGARGATAGVRAAF